MNKKIVQLSMVLVAVVGIFIYGKNQQRKDDLVQKEQARVAAVATAAKAAEDAKRLLADAIPNMTAGKYGQAQTALNAILQKYPNSPEATKAKELQPQAEAGNQKDKKAAEAERQAKAATILSKLRKKVDEVEKITWYFDRSTPESNGAPAVYFYTGVETPGRPVLRAVNWYRADDWLFIEGFTVVADEQRFDVDGVDFKRDNSGGTIWEWSDVQVDNKNFPHYKAIMGAKKAVVRYRGHQYYRDITVSDAEKKAMRNVYEAFEAWGGKL